MNASFFLSAVLAVAAPGDDAVEAQTVSPEDCAVSLIEEREVPAAEAGLIAELEPREGMLVKAGAVLGKIDDEEAKAHKRIKLFEYTAAKHEAENDVNIRYSEKAAKVSYYAWQKAEEANKLTPKAVTPVDVLRLKLDYERAALGIEQAKLEHQVSQATRDMKAAEVHAADINILRREIRSPIDGLVVKVNRRVGEWVSPGDTVLRIMRFDRLHIKGSLDGSQYGPEEIKGRKVMVEVELARRRKVNATGKIVFVSPEVGLDGRYEVWAEVSNKMENNEWVLRPGMPAKMTIYLNDALVRAQPR